MKKLNWIGIFVTSLAIGCIVYGNTIMIIGPSEKVDTTEKPISQPVDMLMDSVDMDCGEYHGKEGESEYGEYEYNKWMELQ